MYRRFAVYNASCYKPVMPIAHVRSLFKTLRSVGRVVKQSFRTIRDNPQIAFYPYVAALFISLTLPLVNGLVFGIWNKFGHSSIFSVVDNTPHRFRLLVGLVAFSAFYTILVGTYFACATSAAVLAKLEGRNEAPLHEFGVVWHKFLKITAYGLIAVFFFPLGVIAQYRKLTSLRGIVEVFGSSLSLHIGQLAPVILTERKGLFVTIRRSTDVLGKAWHEGLIIKAGMYLALLLIASLSFLPKLIDHYLSGEAAHIAGWSAAVLIGASGYVTVKVIGTVLTTTLYYHALKKKS